MKNNILDLILNIINNLFSPHKYVEEKEKNSNVEINISDYDVSEVVEEVKLDFNNEILYVDAEIGLNIRRTPNSVSTDNKIETLKFGEEVVVVEKQGSWFKVKYGENKDKEGWLVSQYLSEENPVNSSSIIKVNLSTI